MNDIFSIDKFIEEKVKDMFNFDFWMPDLTNRQGAEYNDTLLGILLFLIFMKKILQRMN